MTSPRPDERVLEEFKKKCGILCNLGGFWNPAVGISGGEVLLWLKALLAERPLPPDVTVSEVFAYEAGYDAGKRESTTPADDEAFMECDTCRAKSGSPVLCTGCLHNRKLITTIRQDAERKERDRLRKEITEALWNEDGSLKSHNLSDVVSTAIHKTLTPPDTK